MEMKRSKRRSAGSGVSPIGDILKQIFPSHAMPKGLNEELMVMGAWAKAVGPEITKNAVPKSLRNGILFVETRHPIWTVELQAKSHLIREKINRQIGADLVQEVQFRQARI